MKISVIIPVYNVEKYIAKCLNSLLDQSYDDYEIILVDDGSTDGSGGICDEFSEKNDKIKVVHKENGGVSSARNTGLEHIVGNYVTYIDPDDYVDKDYLETLALLTDNGKYEVAIVAHRDESESGKTIKGAKYDKPSVVQVLTPEEALREICYEGCVSTTPCAKLISSRIAKANLFPVGKIYEDLFAVYKIIGTANAVAVSTEVKYHYVQRKGSIRKSEWSDKVYNVWEATESLVAYINENYPKLSGDVINRYFISANEIYIRAFSQKNYLELIQKARETLRMYFHVVRHNENISRKKRFLYKMMTYHPKRYRMVWKLYHAVKRG